MLPHRLLRRYVALSGLRWLPVGLVLPVLVLTMTARGLSLGQIGAVFALYSAVVLLLELPTGGLADTLGRRGVLLLAAGLTVAGFTLYAVAGTVAVFALGAVIEAAGRALGSGPLAAWFVDAVHAEDPAADLQPALARGQAAETGGLAIGSVLGGLLPLWAASGPGGPGLPTEGATLIASSVPILVGAALTAGFAAAVGAWVREPRRAQLGVVAGFRAVPATVQTAVAAAARHSVLRRLLVHALAIGGALAATELLVPARLGEVTGSLTGGTTAYGLLAAAGFGLAAAGALTAPALSRRWGSGRVVAVAPLVAVPPTMLLATAAVPPIAVGYGLSYLLVGLAGPPAADLLHEATDAEVRSTMLSAESMTSHIGGIATSLLFGAVIAAGGAAAAAAMIAGCLVIAGAVMLRR